MTTAKRYWIRPSCGLAAVLAVGLAGCGFGSGEVSGAVRFKSVPLSTGRVTFTSQRNPAATACALIDEDGSYKVTDCPLGPVTITVQTTLSRSGGEGARPHAGPGGPTSHIGLPSRYADPARCGLDLEVRHGREIHDIDLTP
jgi:hypothetical protein